MKHKKTDSRRVTAIIFIILFSVVAIWELTGFFVSFFNYKSNCKIWDDNIGIIYNQHLDGIKDYKYGFGTIGKNGCGAIAVYNIMCLENKKVPLPKIIKDMDDGLFFFGLLGTKPTQILSYLKNQGFDAQLHENKAKFEELASVSKYCIYIYAGTTGGHYTLLKNDTMTKMMHSINPRGMTSISDLIEKNQDQPINLLITVK